MSAADAMAGVGAAGAADSGSELTELDRRVLTEIQAGFPIDDSPYCTLAARLSEAGFETTEMDVLDSVVKMRLTGVIRRVGAIFDSHRLGYRSTLCAIATPEARVDEVAAIIGEYPNVTHNYLRQDRYNVWFTLIAESAGRIEEILGEIAERSGIDDILDLPAIRLFKIRVDFDLTGERGARTDAPPIVKPAETEAVELSEDERALARLLQEDLPTGEHPFEELHAMLEMQGVDETQRWTIGRTQAWVESGVIRRFGAAIKHHKTGFAANAMGVWDCPPERIEEVGQIMASFKEVSHCYERPRLSQWPANLYTMIHGRTSEECEDVARRIQEAVGLPAPRLLYSTREFKKTSMRYFAED
ncbi:MAG: Lrp/AsnC family transcriptional regulator [Actinomycetota bacterium]|nr:Lrp/AsnC family transcriptional regulator [Actinomycetota bacterium]